MKRLLDSGTLVKAIEAYSGLSAKIVENASYNDLKFNALWMSSLTQSAIKSKADNGYISNHSRIKDLEDILENSSLPIIFDGDDGGYNEHFVHTVQSLERIGVSAIVIEDYVFLHLALTRLTLKTFKKHNRVSH